MVLRRYYTHHGPRVYITHHGPRVYITHHGTRVINTHHGTRVINTHHGTGHATQVVPGMLHRWYRACWKGVHTGIYHPGYTRRVRGRHIHTFLLPFSLLIGDLTGF